MFSMLNSKKKHIFLRYLALPLIYFVPLLARLFVNAISALLLNWILGLSFETVFILFLLGIPAVGIGLSLLFLFVRLISFLGLFAMKVVPNKVSFWIMFGLSVLGLIISFFTRNYEVVEEIDRIIVPIPLWIDIILSIFVFYSYAVGGHMESEGEYKSESKRYFK